jgi:hypothetical protein
MQHSLWMHAEEFLPDATPTYTQVTGIVQSHISQQQACVELTRTTRRQAIQSQGLGQHPMCCSSPDKDEVSLVVEGDHSSPPELGVLQNKVNNTNTVTQVSQTMREPGG